MKNWTLLCLLTLSCHVSAKDYFVSPDGSDNNSGYKQSPFASVQKAVNKAKAGDTVYLRAGQYHERVHIRNKHGTPLEPIVIRNYQGEHVEFNGTVKIDTSWQQHKGAIYKRKLDQDIWQLFVNGKDLTSARWPNGNWHDGSVWNKQASMAWPEKAGSAFGRHVNKGLADFDFDLTGAVIIVNSFSFKTYQAKVTSHKGDTLTYDTSNVRQHFSYKDKAYKHGYFLEGKLGLLDQPGEWYYDPATQYVYAWMPDGQSPAGKDIRGKVQSYALTIKNSRYVQVKGIHFFATTFDVQGSDHILFENTHLNYPSYSKRVLGDVSPIDVTKLIVKKSDTPSYNQIRNCRIEYADGPAIEMIGKGNVFENCLIHNIDYSCTYKGGYTLNMIQASDLVFRRNTVHTTGCSELYKAGERNLVELNNLSRSGYVQNDGSMIQVSVKPQNGAIVRNNWVHDSVKQGIRFDNMNTPGAPWGTNGQVSHNVAWNTDRMFFKGDEHFIFNNLSFGSHQNDLITSSNKAIQGHNHKTITRNNISNKFSGHRTKPGKDYPLPGIVDHNWAGNIEGKDVRSVLRDPDNLDFRPKANSSLVDGGAEIPSRLMHYVGKKPDIGPYEFGATRYWIPGYQSEIASSPVPPKQAASVKQNADLMWLEAYQSELSDVYFGDSLEQVNAATRSSKEYKGRFNANIFTPSQLVSGKTYYWRVDSVVGTSIRKGQLWSFTVETSIEKTQPTSR